MTTDPPLPPTTSSGRDPTQSTNIRQTAYDFCRALSSSALPPASLVETYFRPDSPRITEHAPSWAATRSLPFLASTFTGATACADYFTRLADTLRVEMDALPRIESFCADALAEVDGIEGRGVVFVVWGGKFAAKGTGREWQEKFVYRFSGFDESERIGWWEIWADPLSAWDAVVGVGGRGVA